MRIIATCLAILFFGASIVAEEDPVARPKSAKAELKWNLDKKTYYKWDVTSWENQTEAEKKPAAAVYVHYMGYELDELGVVKRVHQPYQYYELAFQFAAYLPGNKQREGDTWDKKWEMDHNLMGSAIFKSTYTFTGAVKIDDIDCMAIKGLHTWEENLGESSTCWNNAKFETIAYFDPNRKLIYGWDLVAETSSEKVVKDETVISAPNYKASWRLKTEQDSGEHVYLRGRVHSAIVKGVARLWKWRSKDGLFKYGTHDRGGTGLALLALLMCGEDPNDERITQSIEAMKAAKMGTIYDVALTIMAIEAKYIPTKEKESFLKGEKVKDFKREVGKEDRQHVQVCVDWILENQNKENDFWNYYFGRDENTTRFDFSITQYAALGISAALRMGHKLPAGYCKDYVTSTIQYQMPEGPEFSPVKEHKPGKRKDRTTYSRELIQARGWHYSATGTWDEYTEKTNTYGSMTCAGLTTLLCGLDNAAQMDKRAWAKEFQTRATYLKWKVAGQKSLKGGNAWMERWFSVTRNPNKGRAHYYYYLYSLERIAMMQDLKYIGTHDWYWEGAAALVELQAGGSWRGKLVDTCFALLFLKRGTVRINDITTGDKRKK